MALNVELMCAADSTNSLNALLEYISRYVAEHGTAAHASSSPRVLLAYRCRVDQDDVAVESAADRLNLGSWDACGGR